MAAALPLAPSEVPLNLGSSSPDIYSRRLTVTDLDFKDTRYPTLSAHPNAYPSSSSMALSYSDRTDDRPVTSASRKSWVEYSPSNNESPTEWTAEKLVEDRPASQRNGRQASQLLNETDSQASPGSSRPQVQSPPSNIINLSQSLPSGSASPFERGSREERLQRMSSTPAGSAELNNPVAEPASQPVEMGQRMSVALDQMRDIPSSLMPPTPRHPSLPMTGIGAGPSSTTLSPIVPLSAGPSYGPSAMQITVSQSPKVFPQQPKYITQPVSRAAYAPPQIPKEEVCIECAMRDQDMADVDVTGPGVWERESDVLYEELVRREQEEEDAGIPHPEHRPRARGDSLSESNLRLWLSVNPKEPSSRQQTLDQYVKSQRSLLEAEALARARAIRESRQLDDRMRDTYTQLRRSAYELGAIAQPLDDTGALRIKAPHTPLVTSPNGRDHAREVTLLENGMIVEQIDVKKEERERRRGEKRERSRARKSSRSSRSGADVASIYSLGSPVLGSPALPTDSGFFSGVRSDSRFSQSMSPSARPSSILTAGEQRPSNLRAMSQASFSDFHSIGSASSPRRSRFFGFKNLSSGWRSSDSLAVSGSMVDMHVALSREEHYLQAHPGIVDIGSNAPTLRNAESWPQGGMPLAQAASRDASQATKKTSGFKKIWKIVTRTRSKSVDHSNIASQSTIRNEDDGPLAPPPPLSYLVNRERVSARRHVSTTSLPTTTSPNLSSAYMSSPPTAPSSLLPSPTSSRPSGGEDGFLKVNGQIGSDVEMPSADSMLIEYDARGRTTRSSSRTLSSFNGPLTPSSTPSQKNRPMSAVARRDKSLPPLPTDVSVEFPSHPMPDARPQTVFTYDPRALGGYQDELAPPQAAFRTPDTRRQSFGGVGSRPHSAVQSLPARGAAARGQLNVPPFLAEEKYSEFGVTEMPLGQWPSAQKSQRSLQVPSEAKPKKRRSRFGLSSLFGKKAAGHDATSDILDYPGYRTSYSDTPYDTSTVTATGYTSTLSAHSGHVPRQSVASKKNIELVDQDREFVAYRYPSTEQPLNLLR